MRILVISDIHGNLTALETVLQAAGKPDQIWCLGDLVGYGPEPNECISLIKSTPNTFCLLGNHDAATLNRIDLQAFNQDARSSITWTMSKLKSANLAFLHDLPEKLVLEGVTLVHGSPRDPVWEYMLDLHTAAENFSLFDTQVCLVGHTHIPISFYLPKDSQIVSWETMEPGQIYKLTNRTIINPGSVGQPRDHDPRAAYALLDPQKMTWQPMRVAYDIEAVQKKIYKCGLPHKHGARLSSGW